MSSRLFPCALPVAGLLALALAACVGERAGAPGEAGAGIPATDQATGQVSPAITEDAAAMAPAVGGGTGMPGPGTIRFDGFGPASFGDSAEALRMAWGADLGGGGLDAADTCHYLAPQPQPEGPSRIAFMIEGDKFMRLDVHAEDIVAPGGGKVGMSADRIEQLYPGRVVVQPHKYRYDEGGQYLRIQPDDGGSGVLLFETDGKVVTSWRVGVPPQLDYVEGCS